MDLAKKLARKPNKNFLVENIKKSSHSPPKRTKARSRSNSRSVSPDAVSAAERSRDEARDRKKGGATGASSLNQLTQK